MIIKASQRTGARSLANHLVNTQDNEHVAVHDIRGVMAQSVHGAFLEIDAVSQGTRCQKPLFSVSFNPPENENVSIDQFEQAFDRLEKKLGLDGQARVVVFHEKEARRHAHVVWSRIDVSEMKAIHMSHFKQKCMDVSRTLYRAHDWQMPDGLIDKKERDPFNVPIAQWKHLKRQSIDPRDIKALCLDAWSRSDGLNGFKHALEDKGLFLARGDRRGYVVLDHHENIYSLSRVGGIRTKELKQKLGTPEKLPSIGEVKKEVKHIYNRHALHEIENLKQKQKRDATKLNEQKRSLVNTQRAERIELRDQQRVKRHLVQKQAKDRYRRGMKGLFDKVSGRHRRVTLINQKEGELLKIRQRAIKEELISRHLKDRKQLQKPILKLRETQRNERAQLAKRVRWLRTSKDYGQEKSRDSKLGREFDRVVKPSTREADKEVSRKKQAERRRTFE